MCAEKCPKKIENEYNEGLDNRKAIYVQYPQAVPLKYCIDKDNCIYLQKGKCRACEKFCPTGAIDFEQKDVVREIKVGSIILSTGFKAFKPTNYASYEYAKFPNVVTALEFERILAAGGPWLGHLVRPSDEKEPKKIAFLQCVGSRDLNMCDNPYCSSVCCMYALKEASIAQEHSKNGLEVTIFYMDMRTFGKDFERYYEKAKAKGIDFIRSRIHTINQIENDSLRITYGSEQGRLLSKDFDMVVLSHGLEVPGSSLELARRLDVRLGEHRFVKTGSFTPVATSRPGIYVCGAFNGPKDIPISVMEASAAACEAASRLSEARGTIARERAIPEQVNIKGEPPRIGVFVCSCGINIAGVVDVNAVAEYARTLPYVAFVQNNLFSCSQDSQNNIAETIRRQNLNRVVVAACTPRTHEPLFQETLQSAGLNKYLFELANIRNQDSWVHSDEPGNATEKAKDQVRMAVYKVALLEPLQEVKLSVKPAALVIGGGIAGMNAALSLSEQGYETHLVERENRLGGNALKLRVTSQGEDIRAYLQKLTAKVESDSSIRVHKGASVKDVDGFVGNFKTTITSAKGDELIEHGAAIIATGAREHKPDEYAYGSHPRVMTYLELDQALSAGTLMPRSVKSAVFIQCVGSREPGRMYCSKVCCTHTANTALHFKKENPDCRVFVLYRDIRTYGDNELLYREARSKGILFIRFDLDSKPVVDPDGDGLKVKIYDRLIGCELTIRTDLVALASAIVSNRDEDLAMMYKAPLDGDGWFLEAHQKLRPVDFANDGVFMAGLAHYPKPVEEAVTQAQAAVSRAVTVLSRSELSLAGTVAFIERTKCVGCGVCWTVCPFKAITQDDKGLAVINEALCKGCGNCATSCRSGAADLRGFSNRDVMAQIEAAA